MSEPAPANLSPMSCEPPRRTFFQWLTFIFGGVAAAAVGLPFVGYVVGVRKQPKRWLSLGSVSDFPENETRKVDFDNPLRQPWDGIVAMTGVYVRNQGKDSTGRHDFLVFAVNCAHLGCPVSWFPQSGLFMCPCHGGVYYANGERASGPPPRGLYHCVWRVTDADKLEIEPPHYPTLHDTLTGKA